MLVLWGVPSSYTNLCFISGVLKNFFSLYADKNVKSLILEIHIPKHHENSVNELDFHDRNATQKQTNT